MRKRPRPMQAGILALLVLAVPLISGSTRSSGANLTAESTIVYVVRHAEKVGEQSDAELSVAGKKRAEVLAWMLRDVSFDGVYSTKFRRTLDTVRPTAKAKSLTIEHYKPGTEKQLALTLRNGPSGKTLLVCGHSNTIPMLLAELGCGIDEKILGGYDDLFIVILTQSADGKSVEAKLQRLHYPQAR